MRGWCPSPMADTTRTVPAVLPQPAGEDDRSRSPFRHSSCFRMLPGCFHARASIPITLTLYRCLVVSLYRCIVVSLCRCISLSLTLCRCISLSCCIARASIPITLSRCIVVLWCRCISLPLSLCRCVVASHRLVVSLCGCVVASHRLVVSLCRCITSDRHDCGSPRDLRRASGVPN